MRLLVVGNGAREHALCWALAASPLCDALICAPGNAGIAEDPDIRARCVDIAVTDIDGLLALAQREKIDLTIVGPEAPLALGIVDRFTAAGLRIFGPTKAAAQLESSKGFTKDFCARHGIPTAPYRRFADRDAALAYLSTQTYPLVIKADGLAAGKGVTIATDRAEAEMAIRNYLAGSLGEAGHEIVIERYLVGQEVSFFALCDGRHAIPLIAAQDHKRVGEGDTGPNTGGMGAYSPVPVFTPDRQQHVMEKIIHPTLKGMAAEGIPFLGILFAGLMMTEDGPYLIEYNVRFGDPECQLICMRLKSDLLPALIAALDGVLDQFDLRWRDEAAMTVVMAAKGYPGKASSGTIIRQMPREDSSVEKLFHAGTWRADDGSLRAGGGRVFSATALGQTLAEVRARAYGLIDQIDWPDGFCRRDIGWRALSERSEET